MVCCIECFCDSEIRAAIEMIGHKGDCPVCKKHDVWIYDSEKDAFNSNVEELLVKYKDEINMPEDLMEELKTNSEDWNIEYIDVKLRVWYCEFLNVRTGPSTDYPIIKTLKQATEVHVVARCVDNGWCLVIADGYIGFQHGSYLANLDY